MNHSSDTIAAIATAPGDAGIAMVRISGPRSLEIADRVFHCKNPPPSKRPANSFIYGRVRGPDTSASAPDIDEAILLRYNAPHSYTREDVVEIQGHGGRQCAKRILRAVLDAGARLSEPGEFTRRAFLNGRIDLLQAEAVADLISARSERAAVAAIEQLGGGLSNSLSSIYDALIKIAGDIEATIDFPGEDIPVTTMSDLVARIGNVIAQLEGVLGTWEEGRVLREGLVVVICGRPNVGKSTLFNLLLGSDRAIVTEIPGTTRDTIEEQIVIDGIPVRLIDTAGLRDADCLVEREGIRRAQTVMAQADFTIYIVDASQNIDPQDVENISDIDKASSVIILNKQDLGSKITPHDFEGLPTIPCAFRQGSGFHEVRNAIRSSMNVQTSVPAHAVISERHRQKIQNALNVLRAVEMDKLSKSEDYAVLAASDIRMAIEHIGHITGRVYSDDLLDSIFSRFCIGK